MSSPIRPDLPACPPKFALTYQHVLPMILRKSPPEILVVSNLLLPPTLLFRTFSSRQPCCFKPSPRISSRKPCSFEPSPPANLVVSNLLLPPTLLFQTSSSSSSFSPLLLLFLFLLLFLLYFLTWQTPPRKSPHLVVTSACSHWRRLGRRLQMVPLQAAPRYGHPELPRQAEGCQTWAWFPHPAQGTPLKSWCVRSTNPPKPLQVAPLQGVVASGPALWAGNPNHLKA